MAWFQSFRKNGPQEVHYRIQNHLDETIKIQVFNEDPEELQEDEDEEDETEFDEDDELFNGFAPFTVYQIGGGQEVTHKQQHAFSDCHVGTLQVNCNEGRMFLVDAGRALREKKLSYSMMTTICSSIDASCKSQESEVKEEKEDERPAMVNLTLNVQVVDSPNKELPRLVNVVVKAIPARASFTLPKAEDAMSSQSTNTDDDTVSASSVQGMLQRLQDIQTMIHSGQDVPETLDEMSERSKLSQLSERSTLSKLAPYSERSTKLSTLSERSRLVSGLEQQLMDAMISNNNNKLALHSERSTSPKLSTLSERSRLVSGLEQEIRDSMVSTTSETVS